MNHLGGELNTPTTWVADDTPIPVSDMQATFNKTENIHKTAHFIPVYEQVFAPYRNRPPTRMLEIGLGCGGSLNLWRSYFPSSATIVGIDGNPKCAELDDPGRGVHVRIGRQEDHTFLADLIAEFGPFDIILDDGSHLPHYTLESFKHLFLHGLRDGGVYLVEDLEWCYMPCGQEPFENETDCNNGTPVFTDVIKQVIDVMHAHYEGRSTDQFQVADPARLSEVEVPLATTLISSVQVWDGIAAIWRQARPLPRLLHNIDPDFLKAWLEP